MKRRYKIANALDPNGCKTNAIVPIEKRLWELLEKSNTTSATLEYFSIHHTVMIPLKAKDGSQGARLIQKWERYKLLALCTLHCTGQEYVKSVERFSSHWEEGPYDIFHQNEYPSTNIWIHLSWVVPTRSKAVSSENIALWRPLALEVPQEISWDEMRYLELGQGTSKLQSFISTKIHNINKIKINFHKIHNININIKIPKTWSPILWMASS